MLKEMVQNSVLGKKNYIYAYFICIFKNPGDTERKKTH